MRIKMSRKRGDKRPAPSKPAAPVPAIAVPHLWSKRLLLAKAQRYADEMHRHERDDWRFVFWSTLTLELLARAALAHVSPVLLADTKSDPWSHLYYALGHSPKAAKFIPKSIEISGAFTRLAEILPEFEARLTGFCAQHISRRNEELHSGGTPFESVPIDTWQPLYYEACDILMKSMGATLADLIGSGDAKTAKAMVLAANDQSAKAVAKSVAAHRTDWESNDKLKRQKLADQAGVWAAKQGGHRVKCPACGCDALVFGGPTAPPVVRLEDDWIIETQEFLPSKFECIACGLKIVGLSHLHACGLASPYKATSTYDPFQYYAAREPFGPISTNRSSFESFVEDRVSWKPKGVRASFRHSKRGRAAHARSDWTLLCPCAGKAMVR